MEITAYRLLYDNVHDFKTTARHVESEIRRYGICSDSNEAVPGMGHRTHHDMWVSMKTVSHFNLGTALELMLKLLIHLNSIPIPHHHRLAELYDPVPEGIQNQLESTYQESGDAHPEGFELVAFLNTASPDPANVPRPPDPDTSSLRGFFEYFDEDVILWQKRYSWELVGQGRWRHYLSDISVFVELINRVMRGIQRH